MNYSPVDKRDVKAGWYWHRDEPDGDWIVVQAVRLKLKTGPQWVLYDCGEEKPEPLESSFVVELRGPIPTPEESQ